MLRAEHGTMQTSVAVMTRSRRVCSAFVDMIAGTLQPNPRISGIMARPCSRNRCMISSSRNAARVR